MEDIIKRIRRYYPVSNNSLEVLFSHVKKLESPKKHLLIHDGVSDCRVYFIEKGFCRSYCLRGGEEITIWFSHEGDITFAVKDLYHNQPGYGYVELLEGCKLHTIHINELSQIYGTNIEIASWGRVIRQGYLLYMDIHHMNRLYLPAREHYEQLLCERPDVVHRAQLGYITSFLGVTPQHLSHLHSES